MAKGNVVNKKTAKKKLTAKEKKTACKKARTGIADYRAAKRGISGRWLYTRL